MMLCELLESKSVRNPALGAVVFDRECDIVVVGLGTAGALAAISAAETGARVCAIDKLNLPGGTATSGGISSYYYGIPGGRFEQTDSLAEQIRALAFIPTGGHFHADAKGMAIERELAALGVDTLCESCVCAVYLDDDGATVRGIRVVTPHGLCDIGCKVLIDATGNGDVCAIAGAEYTEGRDSDAQSQPFSSVRMFRSNDSAWGANFDAGLTSATDAAELNRAIIASNALHCFPPGEPPRLYYITQLPGHREARLVRCDHTLSAEEIIRSDWREKALAYAYSNFDSHSYDWAYENDTACDWMIGASLWGKNMLAPITLESMTVRGFSNLLVVGRAVSVDHFAACLVRMQRCLQKNGEVAGRAAALALTDGKTDVRDVDRAKLETALRASGCLDETMLPECAFPVDTWADELATEKPGEAIWYAAHHLDATRDTLRARLESAAPHAAVNAAIALAIGGDASGLALLRKHLIARDEFVPQTSRARNFPRLYACAYLLGRVGDETDAALLFDLLRERLADHHAFSYAWRGLLTLGERFPHCRQDIATRLRDILERDDFELPYLVHNPYVPSLSFPQPMHNLLRALTAVTLKEWRIDNRLKDVLATQTLTWREQRLFARL